MKKLEEKLNGSKKLNIIVTSIILVVAAIITIISGVEYRSFSKYDVYFFTGKTTEIQKLSDYSPNIKDTVGDSDIYVIKGPEVVEGKESECPSILLLGGTHPNEPAGQIAAVTFLENLVVKGNTIVYIYNRNRLFLLKIYLQRHLPSCQISLTRRQPSIPTARARI